MKRPMLLCGSCALCVSALCCIAPEKSAAIIILIISLLFLVFSLFGGRRRALFLLPALAATVIITFFSFREAELALMAGEITGEGTLYGTVCDVDSYDNAVGYIIDIDRIDDFAGNCRARIISTAGKQLSIGDRVCAKILFSESGSASVYDRSDSIYCTGYLKELYGSRQGDVGAVYALRNRISETVTEKLEHREAGVLLGITLGDKTAISDGITETLRRSGVSHVIVVSGLHLSVLIGGIYSFLRALKMSNFRTGVIGITATVLLMVFTGMTVSVVRAGLTYIVMFAGLLMKRSPDPVNSLFLAMTLIILEEPFAVMNVSFQLSSAATFGVLMTAPYFYDTKSSVPSGGTARRLLRALLAAVSVTFSATLMTLPFTIYHFGTVNIVSILTNLLVSPAVSTALTLTACAIMCSFILPPVTDMLLAAAGILSEFIITVTTEIGAFSFAQITFERPEIPALVAAMLVILFAAACFKKYDKTAKIQKERAVQLWQQ